DETVNALMRQSTVISDAVARASWASWAASTSSRRAGSPRSPGWGAWTPSAEPDRRPQSADGGAHDPVHLLEAAPFVIVGAGVDEGEAACVPGLVQCGEAVGEVLGVEHAGCGFAGLDL